MKSEKYLRCKFLLLFAAMWLAGCVQDDPPPPRVDKDPKVFIMYDNIGSWFNDDVKEAGKAVAAGALAEGHRVVVFHRRSSGSVIYELVRDKSAKSGYRENELMRYLPGENSTLSREIIADVVGWIRENVPAGHYGFAFGSHGSGWLPKNGPQLRRRSAETEPDPFAMLWERRENPITRYFASDDVNGNDKTDDNEKLDISEFVDALDEWPWDFILLDDCFMSSVEALYEMRDLADYIISSPTEIMQYGFPYDRVVDKLFRDDWYNLAGVAKAFVDSYRERKYNACATVSVVRTDQLEPLMETIRAITQKGGNDVNPNEAGIQFYEGISEHVFFDLDEYMYHFSHSVPLYEAFSDQLKKTVVFSDHTVTFFTTFGNITELPIEHFSGLSVFIPWTKTVQRMPYYRQTEWYKDVYE